MSNVAMTNEEKRQSPFLSPKEYQLIQQFTQARLEQKSEVQYESFDGYEVPPRTQFSMLTKPAVSIKYGQLTFSMAAIRLFEGVQYVLPIVNSKKKRLALIMCAEEETSSIQWAKQDKKGKWVNKTITAPDFVEDFFEMMSWDRSARYKALGNLYNSDRGLILVFDLSEAIMYTTPEEYIDRKTGEKKKRVIKYYPDQYKDRYGKTYSDYFQAQQLSLFEDLNEYDHGNVPKLE